MSDYTIVAKKCCKGDLCLHPLGVGVDLPIADFGKDNHLPSGLRSSCKFCDAFNDHWRRVCRGLSREDALISYMEAKAKKERIAPSGYRFCSSGSKCISELGELQPESNFTGRNDRKSGKRSDCIECKNFSQWCRYNGLDRDDPASLIKYNSPRTAPKIKNHNLGNGLRECSRGSLCACSDGAIQHESNFQIEKDTRNDGFSYICFACESFDRWRYKHNRIISSESLGEYNEHIKAYEKSIYVPEGFRICSQREKCHHPNGPILPLSEFNKLSSASDGIHYYCRECNKAFSRVANNSRRTIVNDFEKRDIHNIIKFFHHNCAYCGKRIKYYHLDHFNPVMLGGHTIPSNMVMSCPECNREKWSHDPVQWLTRKFGTDQAKTILDRIYEFFSTVRKVTDEPELSRLYPCESSGGSRTEDQTANPTDPAAAQIG